MISGSFINRSSLRSCVSLFALGAVLISSGCDLTANHTKIDRGLDANVQDYRDALSARDLEFESFSEEGEGVPPLESYVASVSDNLRPMPLVSIAVNQEVPLKGVLYDLARQADYDVELDPRITGAIIFTARNRPFDMVIERISQIAGLRYSFDDDILRVELDTPYTETYKVDYLSVIRGTNGSVSNNISVVTGEGADTGSEFSITSESSADFWGELDTNISQILLSNSGQNYLTTNADPSITVASANPQAPVVAVDAVNESDISGSPLPSPGQDQTQPPIVQAPNVTLSVGALPSSNAGASDENEVSFEPAFSINRQAGMVSVYANERMHEKVSAYLDDLEKSVTSQVLIEAKILEVTLLDEFSTGINWDADVFSGNFDIGFRDAATSGVGFAAPTLSGGAAANEAFISYTSGDISAIVDAISRFGTVKALASPRVTVLNNQPAALNVAQNTVYFELDVNVTDATRDSARSVDVDSEIRNVPEGVLVNVLPTINLDNNSITMQVRPTITRITDFIPDPGVALAGVTGVVSNVPQINVQEIDSVLRMNSGEVAVLGGLLEDRNDSSQEAIPVLGELPVFGSLFRTQGDSVSKTELVIFIKSTILESGKDSVHQTDKDLYKSFARDRRPFKM